MGFFRKWYDAVSSRSVATRPLSDSRYESSDDARLGEINTSTALTLLFSDF
jgi:hypothetical protein